MPSPRPCSRHAGPLGEPRDAAPEILLRGRELAGAIDVRLGVEARERIRRVHIELAPAGRRTRAGPPGMRTLPRKQSAALQLREKQ